LNAPAAAANRRIRLVQGGNISNRPAPPRARPSGGARPSRPRPTWRTPASRGRRATAAPRRGSITRRAIRRGTRTPPPGLRPPGGQLAGIDDQAAPPRAVDADAERSPRPTRRANTSAGSGSRPRHFSNTRPTASASCVPLPRPECGSGDSNTSTRAERVGVRDRIEVAPGRRLDALVAELPAPGRGRPDARRRPVDHQADAARSAAPGSAPRRAGGRGPSAAGPARRARRRHAIPPGPPTPGASRG
jgi:hypothetical protein